MPDATVKADQLEAHRERWRSIAIANDWGRNPFYVQVWVDSEGNVLDSVSTVDMDRDYIVLDIDSDVTYTDPGQDREDAPFRGHPDSVDPFDMPADGNREA